MSPLEAALGETPGDRRPVTPEVVIRDTDRAAAVGMSANLLEKKEG